MDFLTEIEKITTAFILFTYLLLLPVALGLGIVQGLKNNSVLNIFLSTTIPWYGLLYFLRGNTEPSTTNEVVVETERNAEFSEKSIQNIIDLFILDQGANKEFFIYDFVPEKGIFVQGTWNGEAFESIYVEIPSKHLVQSNILDDYKIEKIISLGWAYDPDSAHLSFYRMFNVKEASSGDLAAFIVNSLKVFDIPEADINAHIRWG